MNESHMCAAQTGCDLDNLREPSREGTSGAQENDGGEGLFGDCGRHLRAGVGSEVGLQAATASSALAS